jgi:hypothetical protein
MILSLIVIVLVGVIAYIWASRGFFSALVHMLCVLIAGAIALGVWEPVAYWMLGKNGVSEMFIDMAWGVSLAVPFAAVLAVLRLATNKLLPSNADLDGVTNWWVAACAGWSRAISVRILIRSELPRVPQVCRDDADRLRQQRLAEAQRAVVPVDRIATSLYAYLSTAPLHTATPLAAYRPTLADDGALLRAFPAPAAHATFNTTSFGSGPLYRRQAGPSGTSPGPLTDVFFGRSRRD